MAAGDKTTMLNYSDHGISYDDPAKFIVSSPSESVTLTILAHPTIAVSMTIHWSDTSSTSVNIPAGGNNRTRTKNYKDTAEHTIRVIGDYGFDNTNGHIRDVLTFGKFRLLNGTNMFRGFTKYKFSALDLPDLSVCESMDGMFYGSAYNHTDVLLWDVSNVKSMVGTFRNTSAFNRSLAVWDMSNVLDASQMFRQAAKFNKSLTGWDMTSCTNMYQMFYSCQKFNNTLSSFQVGSVTNMEGMFQLCTILSKNLDTWDMTNVTTVKTMFKNCNVFNGKVNFTNGTPALVESISTFMSCPTFNRPLTNWNMGNVASTYNMFYAATSFNNTLDCSGVPVMQSMFYGASAYNHSSSKTWDVSTTTNMTSMFNGASAFNQNISAWDVSAVTNCNNFRNNAGLSCARTPALATGCTGC